MLRPLSHHHDCVQPLRLEGAVGERSFDNKGTDQRCELGGRCCPPRGRGLRRDSAARRAAPTVEWSCGPACCLFSPGKQGKKSTTAGAPCIAACRARSAPLQFSCYFSFYFFLSFVERICKLLHYGGKRLRCSIPPRGAKDHVRLARLRYGGGDAEREQGSCELPAAPRLRACGPPHVPSCIRTTDALPIFSINFSTTTPNGS